jgi:hypothetical protein
LPDPEEAVCTSADFFAVVGMVFVERALCISSRLGTGAIAIAATESSHPIVLSILLMNWGGTLSAVPGVHTEFHLTSV